MTEATKEKEYGLNRGNLKMIALFCMTIDHFSIAIFESLIRILPKGGIYHSLCVITDFCIRGIGRLAFPIFCFFIVEGFLHTRSVTRYALRLFLLALISEVPFDMVMSHKYYSTTYQNVFWTLLLGLIAVYAIDTAFKKFNTKAAYVIAGIAGVSACLCGGCFKTDYASVGVVTIIAIYLIGREKVGLAVVLNIIAQLIKLYYAKHTVGLTILYLISIALFSYVIIMSKRLINNNSRKAYVACAILSTLNPYELFALINVPIMGWYNGQKGKELKWLYYLYYPVHLAIAAGVCMLVGLY